MPTFSKEAIYSAARSRYEGCENLIIEMSNIIKMVRPEFSTDVALAQFDLVLQCCLISAAAADDEIVPLEKDFIADIVKHTDILLLINEILEANGQSKIEWKALTTYSKQDLKWFEDLAKEVVKPYANEFVDNFVLVDRVVEEKDYNELLSKQSNILFAFMGGIDGDDMACAKVTMDTLAGIKTYNELVFNRWKSAVNG